MVGAMNTLASNRSLDAAQRNPGPLGNAVAGIALPRVRAALFRARRCCGRRIGGLPVGAGHARDRNAARRYAVGLFAMTQPSGRGHAPLLHSTLRIIMHHG